MGAGRLLLGRCPVLCPMHALRGGGFRGEGERCRCVIVSACVCPSPIRSSRGVVCV